MSYLVTPTCFFKIEARETVYAIQPGCCYEYVSYSTNHPDVSSLKDYPGDYLSTHDFMCQCHPNEHIIPINKEEYDKIKEMVRKLKWLENNNNCCN